MTLLQKYRVIWITVIAWCLAVSLNQITRGYPIVPPGISPAGYWTIHLIIGAFIGGIFWFFFGVLMEIRRVSDPKKRRGKPSKRRKK